MTIAQACELLGVNPATFAAKCSRSKDKAWPLAKGVPRQASVAEPYPHFYAYRVDPRGRWRVTMFEQSEAVLTRLPQPKKTEDCNGIAAPYKPRRVPIAPPRMKP